MTLSIKLLRLFFLNLGEGGGHKVSPFDCSLTKGGATLGFVLFNVSLDSSDSNGVISQSNLQDGKGCHPSLANF